MDTEKLTIFPVEVDRFYQKKHSHKIKHLQEIFKIFLKAPEIFKFFINSSRVLHEHNAH